MFQGSRLALAGAAWLMYAAANAGASITVTYPSGANYLHRAFNGEITSTLTPDPVANANEFFLLNGVSQTVQDEISSGDWEIGEWTFDYSSKWRNTATGNLTIDRYEAIAPANRQGGAVLQTRYTKGTADPTMNLQWIQLVTPIGGAFDPDQTYNPNTGVPGVNGPINPANGAFIDPYPNDGSDGGPFYWNSDEIGGYTSSGDNFGTFDLKFFDRPRRTLPVGGTMRGYTFELYLVNWDGNSSGHVEFLDGIQWGFVVVPAPSTIGLAAFGSIFALRRRRSASVAN